MIRTLAAALATTTCVVAMAAPAAAQTREFNIPAGSLRTALDAFSRQSGRQVIYRGDVRSARSPGARGARTAEDALNAIVAGSGFVVKTDRSGAFAIVKAGNGTVGTNQTPGRMRPAGGEAGAGSAAADDESAQADIVVTAQKREERLQDVPVSVAVVRTDALVESNQVLLRDYFSTVPGLNVVPSIQSNQTIAIRGVTTGIGNPTVGVTIDDVPYGASTNLGGGRLIPDIDPGDLARIEVLKGPQGTLYGANSLGGLLKFVTRDPSTEGFSGRVRAGISSIRNSDTLGYSLRGGINVPLGENAAISASGFTRRDAGYVTNLTTGKRGTNSADAYGGRAALLVRLGDSFTLKLGAIVQTVEGDGSDSVDPAAGDLNQRRLAGTGGYTRKAQAYSAVLTGDLGSVDLTSITGYNFNSSLTTFDFSYLYGGIVSPLFGGATGAPLVTLQQSRKFSQEVRAAVPITDNLDWLVGGFYTRERSTLKTNVFAANAATGAVVGQYLGLNEPNHFEEYSAFTNLTYRFSDQFDLQIGARQTHINQDYTRSSTGPGAVPPIPFFKTQSDAFTYLITPRFKITPNAMLYARVASGYRSGGPNPGIGVPPKYDPDKTQSYEVGFKGSFFDRALTIDASIYYIDWKSIQLTIQPTSGFVYTTNGSDARSKGVEVSAELKPFKGMTIAGWISYNDGALSENFPTTATTRGVKGDQLPNSARWTSHLSVDQEFPLNDNLKGFVGGTFNTVGDRFGPFRAVALRQKFEAYTQVDLRAGLRNDRWSASIFVNNLGDERGTLYGGLAANPPTAFTYIQPRTVGLTLGTKF